MKWPQIFEDRLQSLRKISNEDHPTRTRAQHSKKSKANPDSEVDYSKDIQLTGWGHDYDDDFYSLGWLNPLPEQGGIPGWQRITLMKHFLDEFEQEIEEDNLWAYEGVVLPGGRIILGRWWYATDEVDFDNDYNGPFILWAVDEPDLEDEEGTQAEDDA